ncbi:MAG: ABC transporter permease [Helicobacteraceae bacterium]|jgi:putative ABC transport system permease protein|nr:ABC transporter permease [Helicobacteraceae bacterium]
MKAIFLAKLAAKSAWSRRGTLFLIVFAIAISAALLLGVARARAQLRDGFSGAISGTDLVVGAQGGDIQLVLYAIFHIGSATRNMGWESAQEIAKTSGVAWTIPISLGDSHAGYPVVATDANFYAHYKFHGDHDVKFAEGRAPNALFEVAIGSEAAKRLGYAIGDLAVLNHGAGLAQAAKLTAHDDMPFAVVGVIAPTATAIDRSLFISLESMEAIHINWRFGAPMPGFKVGAEQVKAMKLTPKSITALLVGLDRRSQVFHIQREIAEMDEPLTAVMPGVALDQIWEILANVEAALTTISAFGAASALAGLIAAILAGLNERRREIAILRSAGASAFDIFTLLAFEGILLVLGGIFCALAIVYAAILTLAPFLADNYGVFLTLAPPNAEEFLLLILIAGSGVIASILPAIRAYRASLSDGLRITI